jgi:hypothetical protein
MIRGKPKRRPYSIDNRRKSIVFTLVELWGIEPQTSAVRLQR